MSVSQVVTLRTPALFWPGRRDLAHLVERENAIVSPLGEKTGA